MNETYKYLGMQHASAIEHTSAKKTGIYVPKMKITWCNQTDLDRLDRLVRMMLSTKRQYHPLFSMHMLYILIKNGDRGLRNFKES